MKTSIELANEQRKYDQAKEQELFEMKKREEDRVELKETEVSKSLAAAMVKSSKNKSDDILTRAVDVLQNQNSKFHI